ncbi:MAG: sodium-dependent transporter, partial [Defluviitaleaceae bacterium]|nr:sodium-dependent transporter [Defluviitaleaceae bacterium]
MEKQQFSSRGMFILAAIGSAVGLGNIWRYPFVAFDNGGGAFLIPYFIALITAAFPILLLEFLIGNKFRGSAPLSWARIKSKWEFLGWLPSVVAGMII